MITASPHLKALLDRCLERVPHDRPKAALDVYLQLQELGKASGVLLLPPGALSKLVASRKSHDSTVTYTVAPSRTRRKWLVGAGGLALLLVLGFLGRSLVFPPAYSTGPELLHGIQNGDTEETVEQLVAFSLVGQGNPWQRDKTKDRIGHVVRPEDLDRLSGRLPATAVSASGAIRARFRSSTTTSAPNSLMSPSLKGATSRSGATAL